MKKFFIQDIKEGSIQSGYLFILINVVWFAGGIAGLDYGNFDRVLQLFWSFSLVGILLGLKDLQEIQSLKTGDKDIQLTSQHFCGITLGC